MKAPRPALGVSGWCLILCIAWIPTLQAAEGAHRILLLLSAETAPYQALVRALQASLDPEEHRQLRLQIQALDRWRPDDATPAPDLLVTSGLRALQAALAHRPRTPILATLVPRLSYRRATADHPGPVSALYIDQPPARYLALLRATLPRARRIAVLLSPAGATLLPELRAAAARRGLEIEHAQVADRRQLARAMRRLFPRSDALLALADPGVYNRYTLKNLLLASYREHLPVIAYSRAFVRAGALAAVYTTPAQLGLQLADLLGRWMRDPDHRLPPPRYPEFFVVDVNRPLAQAMGILVPHESVLMDRITRFQGESQ